MEAGLAHAWCKLTPYAPPLAHPSPSPSPNPDPRACQLIHSTISICPGGQKLPVAPGISAWEEGGSWALAPGHFGVPPRSSLGVFISCSRTGLPSLGAGTHNSQFSLSATFGCAPAATWLPSNAGSHCQGCWCLWQVLGRCEQFLGEPATEC